jgi:muramidase (phage lysozyme)
MSILADFFSTILAGESKTYNDHNWYVSGGKLKGYIQGKYGTPYSLLGTKPLSEHTIGEVMQFQARGRDATGQLWATGRYQIIPNTLKGLVTSMKLPPNTKYDKATQDAMGLKLLTNRTPIRQYVTSEIADTKENLEKAALSVAMIWSSVGVPYPVQGRHQMVQKNQSYYSGGGDRATVTTESIQEKLRMLRNNWGNITTETVVQKKNILIILLIVVLGAASWTLYRTLKRQPIIPSKLKMA